MNILFILVHFQTADIAICAMAITPERLNAIDMTKVLDMSPYGLITKRPGLISREWVTLDPFSGFVWTLLFVSLLVTVIIIKLSYYSISCRKGIWKIYFSILGIIFQQCK